MTFHEYNSLDEAINHLRSNEVLANGFATEAQRGITWGDKWMAFYSQFGVITFGEVWTQEYFREREIDAGASETEADLHVESNANDHQRGYRFGRAYSPIEPEGELGSTHISVMMKISEEEFEAVKTAGWKMQSALERGVSWAVELAERWNRTMTDG